MAVKFDNIQVGDQLVERGSGMAVVVTDLWFDPVRGQKRAIGGMMSAVQIIGPDGEPRSYKRAYSRATLATTFDRADHDIMAALQAETGAFAQAVEAANHFSVMELERIRQSVKRHMSD